MSNNSFTLNDNLKERLTVPAKGYRSSTIKNSPDKFTQEEKLRSNDSRRTNNACLKKLQQLQAEMQSELNQLQEMLNMSPQLVQTECFLVQLVHLNNMLIEGIQNEQDADEQTQIPINVAMRVYVQLKFLLNKQLPDVVKMQPRGSVGADGQANMNIFTQKMLDFTLSRLMQASASNDRMSQISNSASRFSHSQSSPYQNNRKERLNNTRKFETHNSRSTYEVRNSMKVENEYDDNYITNSGIEPYSKSKPPTEQKEKRNVFQ